MQERVEQIGEAIMEKLTVGQHRYAPAPGQVRHGQGGGGWGGSGNSSGPLARLALTATGKSTLRQSTQAAHCSASLPAPQLRAKVVTLPQTVPQTGRRTTRTACWRMKSRTTTSNSSPATWMCSSRACTAILSFLASLPPLPAQSYDPLIFPPPKHAPPRFRTGTITT